MAETKVIIPFSQQTVMKERERASMTDIKKIFWEFVSFFGTFPAGMGFVVLAFVLDFTFGLIVFLNLALITAASNSYKVYYFKPRPDNPEGIRPPKPFEFFDFKRFLNLKDAIAYFKYVDAGSFPSIHSARAFNQAALFASFLGGGLLWPLFLLFALSIAISRVVKKRHFITDITAGAVLGLLVAWLSF